jgi:catechol 2,3-dioxygenase-like lactoylglutathione lyase family enzyme
MTRLSIHARLLIKDYQACFLFYRDIMEFEVTWDDGNYTGFQDGGMRLALFKRHMMAETIGNIDKPIDAECQDKLALIFEVADVDEYHRQLREKGVQFVKDPLDYPSWGIRAAFFRDPDGNLIEINSGLSASE